MNNELQKTWRETKFRGASDRLIDEVLEGKRITALQRLARRYRHFSAISGVAVATSLVFLNMNLIPEERRLATTLAFALYFFIASMMDLWLCNGVSSIDCTRMNVSEVASKALFYRKRHFQFMAILLPMAFALMALLAWNFGYNKYCIGGMCVGFLLGISLGLGQLLKFLADYRDITD